LTTEDEFSLTGRVAVVTGGSSGIGAASVRRLAAAGARVVVGYNRGLDRAEKLMGALPGTGHCAMHLPLEDSAQIRRVAAAVGSQFGRADILVNSAGFTRMVPHADLEALDDELIDAVLTANVRGPFATIRAFAPLLRSSGNGVIVNISSGAAARGGGSTIIYLRRVKSGTRYNERGVGSGARSRDPCYRHCARDGPYRLRAWPY